MKVLTNPFLCGRKGGPLPHHPAPSFGRCSPGISGSSSVVASSSGPAPAADSSTSSAERWGSKSRSGPSRSGLPIPFSSASFVAASILDCGMISLRKGMSETLIDDQLPEGSSRVVGAGVGVHSDLGVRVGFALGLELEDCANVGKGVGASLEA